MIRDREIGDRRVVEVAPAQVIDVVTHRRELEAKEALSGPEVA